MVLLLRTMGGMETVASASVRPALKRQVLFVKYYDKGSTVLGAEQISRALRGRGVDTRVVYAWELGGVSGAILVFIKTSRLDHLARAHWRRNLLVLDVQDTVCFKRRIKNLHLYHGLIFRNRRQLEDFGGNGHVTEVIYHQWDPRYQPHRAGESELQVAYLGRVRSLKLWGQVPGVRYFETNWFREALRFNCHLSVRSVRRESLYKPNSKISTAAACGAVLVTTPDDSALELLGPDYPYYTGCGVQAVRQTIERARTTMGGDDWRTARNRLQAVRERTSLDRIATSYVEYLARLG